MRLRSFFRSFLLCGGLLIALFLMLSIEGPTRDVLSASPVASAATTMADTGPAAVDTAPAPVAARTRFTYHLYVDPIYGDNNLANAQNPKGAPGPNVIHLPLMKHRWASVKGYLQHHPYSFKTVGGQNGALAWVSTLTATNGNNLPWQHPDTTDPRWIDYIVIHCLPGLYGPKLPSDPTPPVDGPSGLVWNGETCRVPRRLGLASHFRGTIYTQDVAWYDRLIGRHPQAVVSLTSHGRSRPSSCGSMR
jgi:hypothetical protein